VNKLNLVYYLYVILFIFFSLEKRVRTGPTIALVRPTTLSCQGPALQPPPSPKLSVSPQSSVTIVCNSNGSSTVVCPIVSTSSVMESVAKEVVHTSV
jgi:hypothetical protein